MTLWEGNGGSSSRSSSSSSSKKKKKILNFLFFLLFSRPAEIMEEWVPEETVESMASEYFSIAAYCGDVEEVKEILRKNPNLNVNWAKKDLEGSASVALGHACENDHDVIVSILLAHPDIDVNLRDTYGNTPFGISCVNGSTSCVREMLKDSRVELNEPDESGNPPIVWTVAYEHIDIIRWWIASGREIDLGKLADFMMDAIETARENVQGEIAKLLERFKENPEETRGEVRRELGIKGQCSCSLVPVHLRP